MNETYGYSGELRSHDSHGGGWSPDSGEWTFQISPLPARKPVTLDTVRHLLRDDDLRDVAHVALKYAKKNGHAD